MIPADLLQSSKECKVSKKEHIRGGPHRYDFFLKISCDGGPIFIFSKVFIIHKANQNQVEQKICEIKLFNFN